jgi:transcriptional regulator with XRE-family HTH domain
VAKKATKPTFAEVIRRAVRDSGKTPYAVAQESGVPQAVLSRFLRGLRSVNLDTAEKLCRALGLDLRPAEE